MIIPNSYVKLNYDPITDILIAELPDLKYYEASEVDFIFKQIVDAVRYYNVGYLIKDTRHKIEEVPDQIYEEAIFNFTQDLKTTNLKKIARLIDIDSSKLETLEELKMVTGLTIPIKNFTRVEDCVAWLNEKEVSF